MYRRMTIFLAVFVFTGCFLLSEATRVRACDVTEYSLDAGGAWARLDTYEHMGSPNTTYTYADTTTRSGYASYVTAGFNAWGVFVSCAETTSNPMGTIGSGYYTGNVLAFAEVESDAGKHVTTCSITVNRMYFDSSLHSEALKTLTLTHEIGHVYGLGHVSDSTQIMYNVMSEDLAIRTDDYLGMEVVTHFHTHNFGYTKETTSHIQRCSICALYKRQTCTYTHYHSGLFHFYQIDCVCGNKKTIKRECSGPPCVVILDTLPMT